MHICSINWLFFSFFYLQAKEARKKAIEDMDPKTREAMENMKFYKFYPVQTPDTPDISHVKVCAPSFL